VPAKDVDPPARKRKRADNVCEIGRCAELNERRSARTCHHCRSADPRKFPDARKNSSHGTLALNNARSARNGYSEGACSRLAGTGTAILLRSGDRGSTAVNYQSIRSGCIRLCCALLIGMGIIFFYFILRIITSCHYA